MYKRYEHTVTVDERTRMPVYYMNVYMIGGIMPHAPIYFCLPGLMQPVTLHKKAMKHYLVDGGIVCNYPLHCYDGNLIPSNAQ